MIRAVLFDFDGTIVDSLKHHLKAWKKTFLETGEDLTDDEIVKNIFYKVHNQKNPKYKVDEKRYILYQKYIHETYEELEKHQHIDEVLAELKKKEVKMAIISFANRAHIVNNLGSFGLEPYFEIVLGGDDVKNPKPDPEIAVMAMEKLGVQPEETILVGDTNWDILTGKNAKTKTALFLPPTNLSFVDLKLFRETNPDFEFESFSEFMEIVERL